jgi:glycosyltransferase involved in cell wall biosynthesis
MKIAFIAAGAANMICGSCLRDAAVARAMTRLRHDVVLVPLYTPLRLDRDEGEAEPVFYGGINVYLQQKFEFFRKNRIFDAVLNSRPALSLASKFAGMTRAEDLGQLAVSTLRGEEGSQAREIEKLADYLLSEIKPEIINLPNSMLIGLAPRIRKLTGVPVVCSLTGEDLFLEGLSEPYKSECIRLLREKARQVDGLIAISSYYARRMAALLDVPAETIHVVPLGLDAKGYGRSGPRPTNPFVIGYLARIAPEKGFHVLAEAFIEFKKMPGTEKAQLRAAGWLGPRDRPYLEKVRKQLSTAGLAESFTYAGEVTFEQKLAFLSDLSVLSVPTVYADPKGLFVLEALAHGVPVVQPNHGSFPELIDATGGGLLFEKENPKDLAARLHEPMINPALADSLAEKGRLAVRERMTDEAMARATLAVYERYLLT